MPQSANERPFTEIHHNNKSLILCFLDDDQKAKECRQCQIEFPRRQKIILCDAGLSHEEKWAYPDPKQPGHKVLLHKGLSYQDQDQIPMLWPLAATYTSWGKLSSSKVSKVYVTQQKRHPWYSAARDSSSSSLALRLLLLDQKTKRLCTLNSGLESVKSIQNYVKVFALKV